MWDEGGKRGGGAEGGVNEKVSAGNFALSSSWGQNSSHPIPSKVGKNESVHSDFLSRSVDSMVKSTESYYIESST